ncbi:lipase family protein [Haloechinothrix halophila]|uniref:lipase family protein n=1 Tax=Haloechinothrix halophila TaxID=1069073 RepID=UPI0012FAB7E0|nr:lipase family protein [Haloechinothrix halophila]
MTAVDDNRTARARMGRRRTMRVLVTLGATTALVTGAVTQASAAAVTPATQAMPQPAALQQAIPPPQDDPFYTPPDPLPDVEPGTVFRSRQIDVSDNGFSVPVNAWQVLYRSTSATFEPNAVSGTVIVPEGAWTGEGERPLVSYAVGTHGLGPECAPSYKLATGSEREFSLFSQALNRGWAVVVTDYEGLGTPGPHTYVAGRSLGHAQLDATRAAAELPDAGLGDTAQVGLWGYSEGGFSTAWAAQRAADYAPELNVAGAAVGAAPADMEDMANLHDGGPASGLVLAAAVGLARAYPDAPFEEILTDEGKEMAAEISTQCVEEFSARYAFRSLSSYTTVDDPMALPEWQRVLDDIRLGGTTPQAPAMIYHSPTDELVTFDQAIVLNEAWCGSGATVQFQPAVIGDHVLGAITGAPLAVDYLGGRFTGQQAPDTCATAP